MDIKFVNQQYEDQIVDQYLSGDTACRVFATLEYYTYRSNQKPVPGIFAKYNGKNNSGVTKSLEQLKRQLKTHVLSFLASHQDMINVYGSYPFPNNFQETEAKAFITNCQKQIKDPEVKIYCDHLISIIKKDYKTVLNYYKNALKKDRPEMDPKTQISKHMKAIGYSYQNEEKAAKLAKEGKFTHNIEINELAKRKMLIQSNFMNCINSLNHYSIGYLSEDDITKELEGFIECFKENEKFFEYPQGYNEKTTKAKISHIAKRNRDAYLYCMIFTKILSGEYDSASTMLMY